MDKKTLQKKIKRGDTIWTTYWAGKLSELNLKEDEETYWEIEDDYLFKCSKLPYLAILRIHIGNVFATKEEAEWQLEFGNVTRTEKLELPTWEQLEKDCRVKYISFKSKDGAGYTFAVGYTDDVLMDWTIIVYHDTNDFHRVFDFTYAGYLEACRLCKKLFLGEEL